MRIKATILPAALLCAVFSVPHQVEARARGNGVPFAMSAPSVGYSGGAVIGAYASPYYYSPYGYAPAYYHSVPSYGYSVPAYTYGYGYDAPAYTYGYGTPYAYPVSAPCWYRRQAIYGTYGEVAGIHNQYVCQ